VAKTPIDELVRTVEAVRVLKQLVEEQQQALGHFADRVRLLEARLDALERVPPT
jgi:hypothetical protein